MNRRWLIWTLGIFLLALLLSLPLRTAIGRLTDSGFTARQVAGTIWYGRVGELHLRRVRLGTFEARLNPLALLTGSLDMGVNRLDDPQGRLTGNLLFGRHRGVRGLTGRVVVAGMFGNLPLDGLDFDDLTVLFRGERCSKAEGRVSAIVSPSMSALMSGERLSGTARCESERVRLSMTSAATGAKLDLLIRPGGEYRGWMSVRGVPAGVSGTFAAAGFRQTPEGLRFNVEGRL